MKRKMAEMTEKDQRMNFREMYDALPERSAVKAPKTEWVERMAAVTMKSMKTVRCWLAGTQKPDALSQSMLEKELGVSATVLFPETEDAE